MPEDRDEFTQEVPLGTRTGTRNRQYTTVAAKQTCCEYAVIHRTTHGSGITITHINTGFYILTGLPDELTARYIVGALLYELPWAEDRAPAFQSAMEAMDPILSRWFWNWRLNLGRTV